MSNFYLLLWVQIGIALMFNPGTNANNVSDYGMIKTLLFLVVCVVCTLFILSPFFIDQWKVYRYKIVYYIHALILLPTMILYVIPTTRHLFELL